MRGKLDETFKTFLLALMDVLDFEIGAFDQYRVITSLKNKTVQNYFSALLVRLY